MAECQGDDTLRRYQHELDQRIFTALSSLNTVKFGFLKLGQLCNASESNCFTSARCHTQHITNDNGGLFTYNFGKLFQPAMDLLEKLREDEKPLLGESDITAIEKLKKFMKDKGKNF